VTRTDKPASGLITSDDLKARVLDFMERADKLLSHPLADCRAPFKRLMTKRISTGEVSYELDHNPVDEEPLVYLATIVRPIIFTESEPIYFPALVSAIGHAHPALRPHCHLLSDEFKKWKRQLFVGSRSNVPAGHAPIEDWTMVKVRTAPVGTPLPGDMPDAELIEDFYFATAEYRAAGELMQAHYRKCAEIRVFSAIQMLVRPLHRYISDAREIGEDC
jgi:hypothetical protein